jgi:ATP-dependent Clp protease ATP-binding subunit ClpX
MHVSPSPAKFDPHTFSQQALAKENKAPTSGEDQSAVPKKDETVSVLQFLRTKTPALIEQELNELIIGQPELTKAVADFLYYHALRQLHPELPQRPLLISGPSGSGKTEVWRAASRLYGDTFSVKIIDGSSLSCEGWSGNYKLDTYVDSEMASGILVVDEFDKLARPKHNSKGDNVSLDMQSEFLKLMEGEYHITKDRKQTGKTSQQMGFVLVGAFESLRNEAESRCCATTRIGFCTDASTPRTTSAPSTIRFTDEDFIHYGIMPEIVGRIATKCSTLPLDEGAYMDIIYSPHSRVSQIQNILKRYGTAFSDLISEEELHTLISTSKSNKTGVRWVSAQVENRLLNAIREQGLFSARPEAA